MVSTINWNRLSSFRAWVKAVFPRRNRSQRPWCFVIAVFVVSLLAYRMLVWEVIPTKTISASSISIRYGPESANVTTIPSIQLKQSTEALQPDSCDQPELCVRSDPQQGGACTLQPCLAECEAKLHNGTTEKINIHYGTGKKIIRENNLARQRVLVYPYACLTSRKYRFTFIHVLKSGGSAIHVFLKAALCPDGTCSNMPNVFQQISCPTAFTQLRDFLTFSFVRNPYSRYYSAFAMANSEDFRLLPDPLDVETFANASATTKQRMTRLHLSHFYEQYRFLFDHNDCPVFDVLGRLEHVEEDFPYILSLINSPVLWHYYNKHGLDAGNGTNYGSRAKGSNFSLPYTLRSPHVRSMIQQEYAGDFSRFGMDPLEVPPR